MSDEMPTEKRCTKCRETKPIDAFYKKGGKQKGYETHCKVCKNQRGKERYAANAEAICKHHKEYRAANIEMLRKREAESRRLYMRKYRHANGERLRERDRAYRVANAIAIRDRFRAKWLANPKKYSERAKEWQRANTSKLYSNDPNHPTLQRRRAYARAYYAANLDTYRAARHQRRARKKGNGGTFTSAELKAMRAEQNGICAYCQRQYDPDHLQIDHIIPLSRGGRHEKLNICLACPRCNFTKHNKLLSEWLDRWYEQEDKDL